MPHIEHTIAPIYDPGSRVLLLGTMPSPKSRAQGFYYGHPQNRFWPTLAAVLSAPVPGTIEEKRSLALANHIAIWDVLQSCDIDGASDASIRSAAPNDLCLITRAAPIAAVFTTGKKAYELYYKFSLDRATGLDAVCLPSTSPANRRVSDSELITAYAQIREYL